MKTKNIFRTLLIAVGLLMGVNNVKAEERTIWNGSQSSDVEVAQSAIGSVGEGDILRVYFTIDNQYNWQFSVSPNGHFKGSYFANWNGANWGDDNGWQDCNNGHNTLKDATVGSESVKMIELEMTNTGAEELSKGLLIKITTNITIKKITLEANDTPKYTLTYVVDGNTVRTEELKEGDSPKLSGAATKEGYTFDRWENLPKSMPAEDVTTTAVFTINSYSLTFKIDGQADQTSTVEYGATITYPANPTKAGFTFSGWDHDNTTMPANNLVITARFVPTPSGEILWEGYFDTGSWQRLYISDNIFADINVGDTLCVFGMNTADYWQFEIHDGNNQQRLYMNSLSAVNIVNENMVTYLKTAVNGNYASLFGQNFVVTAITLKEKHEPVGHTLTIVIDGVSQTKDVVENAALANQLPTPSKTGYTFAGWSGMPENGLMPNSDLTLTATFTVNKYNLTYWVDGVQYGDATQVEYGTTITPPANPTKEGYTFTGWSNLPTTMPAYDVAATATFQEAVLPTYPIYYQVGDQTVYVEWLKEGDTPNPPASASKTGYTFERWTGVPATMPAESVVASAVFTINSYILTYMVNDEQYGSSEVLEYGTTVTPKTAPEMEGYVFTGWSNLPRTMPAHDVTVTGYFVMEAEKVTATISSSTGYTTFCSNRPLDFTNVTGLKAYIAKSISSTRVQLEQVTGAIAAGTGLILKGETSNIPVAQSEGVTPSNNLLVGVVSKSEKVCSTSKYVLAVINNVATFAATGAYEATVPAGHAYLEAPSSANGARLTIIFPEEEATTDIISVIDTEADDNTIYDLGGHVVTNPKKGCLYIIKGRKTVFK